jgi:O-antigen ligase
VAGGFALAQSWSVRAAAVALPLAYWPLTYDRYVLPKLLLARLVVLLLAALVCVRWWSSGEMGIRRTPLDLPLLAFVASATLATIVSVNVNVSVFGTYSRYDGLLTLITYAALFWLAVQALRDRDDARAALRALVVGGYGVALVAIVQWFVDSLHGQIEPRAYGTMGNANVLGAYLALLMPVAYLELRAASSPTARILAANALITMAVAVLLSVSHSAWLALVAAAVVLLIGGQLPTIRSRRWQVAAVASVIAALAIVSPIALSRSTDVAQRLHIWRDSLALIAGRPIAGYGPDTFGLVYPRFQTGQWVLGYVQIDKAHSEILQVAATQGLLGLAAWAWLMVAFVLVLYRAKAWVLLSAFVAYQVVLLVNFTALSAAFPFWIFAAAAMHSAGAAVPRAAVIPRPALLVGGAAAVLLVVPGVGLPLIADQRLQQAVDADVARQPRASAAAPAADAHWLQPQESVYAVEVGNIAFEWGDWAAARTAYDRASQLGLFNPTAYRNLALADQHLGLKQEAVTAARRAVYLDRFDPVNQALFAQVIANS